MAHQNVVDVIASNVNITSITKAQSIDYISVVPRGQGDIKITRLEQNRARLSS